MDNDQRARHADGGARSGKRWLITVVAVALVAGMLARLLTRQEELTEIRRLSTTVLLVTIGFQFISQLLWNGAMLLPLKALMTRLGFWELFMVRTGGLLAGYAVPVAGNLAVRMAYLKRRGLTYSGFTWATMLSNILALFSGGVLAAAALVILSMTAGSPSAAAVGLTAGLVALGAAGLAVFYFLPTLARRWPLQRWPWLSGLNDFSASARTTTWALALLLMRHLFNFLTFGLLFQSISRDPNELLTGGLVYAITSPVRMVAITPGNLGVNEWVVAVVGKALSFDLTTGLVVALAFRAVSFAGQSLGVLLGGAWLAVSSGP
jgi:uncharacterized membrane protein YbhN (UPF0104 family)